MTHALSGADVLGYYIALMSIITWIIFSLSGMGTWALTISGLVQVLAYVGVGGATGVQCAILTIPVAAAFIHAVLRRPPAASVTDDALEVICDPCHGMPGRCTCTRKCEWELCGADDTGVHDITAELDAWFREGGKS